jgi:hypothetical protein
MIGDYTSLHISTIFYIKTERPAARFFFVLTKKMQQVYLQGKARPAMFVVPAPARGPRWC